MTQIRTALMTITVIGTFTLGCSTRGRQGYLLAQELGNELEGILANDPDVLARYKQEENGDPDFAGTGVSARDCQAATP